MESDSRYGLYLKSSSRNEILDNELSDNTWYGLILESSMLNEISDNNVLNNDQTGIRLQASNKNTMTGNIVQNNDKGIYLLSSSDNIIHYNSFITNVLQAYDNGVNFWNQSYPFGGNYWDNWTSPDDNTDGFVDNPFVISGGSNKDYWPFASMNGWNNLPPSEIEVDLTPDYPFSSEDLICYITTPAVDPEGNTITYTFQWYRDSGSGFVLQPGLTTVSTNLFAEVDSAYTSDDDIWKCVVTPNDGTWNGLSAEDSVVVLNIIVLVEDLIALINDMDIHHGIKNSLISKLEGTIGSLEKGQENAAANKLGAFINECEAQRGKKLTEEQADTLIEAAQEIIDFL
jgi:parallel beta-helix repeat protein